MEVPSPVASLEEQELEQEQGLQETVDVDAGVSICVDPMEQLLAAVAVAVAESEAVLLAGGRAWYLASELWLCALFCPFGRHASFFGNL